MMKQIYVALLLISLGSLVFADDGEGGQVAPQTSYRVNLASGKFLLIPPDEMCTKCQKPLSEIFSSEKGKKRPVLLAVATFAESQETMWLCASHLLDRMLQLCKNKEASSSDIFDAGQICYQERKVYDIDMFLFDQDTQCFVPMLSFRHLLDQSHEQFYMHTIRTHAFYGYPMSIAYMARCYNEGRFFDQNKELGKRSYHHLRSVCKSDAQFLFYCGLSFEYAIPILCVYPAQAQRTYLNSYKKGFGKAGLYYLHNIAINGRLHEQDINLLEMFEVISQEDKDRYAKKHPTEWDELTAYLAPCVADNFIASILV